MRSLHATINLEGVSEFRITGAQTTKEYGPIASVTPMEGSFSAAWSISMTRRDVANARALAAALIAAAQRIEEMEAEVRRG